MTKFITTLLVISLCSYIAVGQNEGTISGAFQFDGQLYQPDEKIGTTVPDEKYGMNSLGYINYTKGKFSAGVRFEAYNPPLQGFSNKFEGAGLANYFADYKTDFIQITVGNFYEQFGSGLILRTYEERNLGYDNSLFGARVKVQPYKGVTITGLSGTQRYFWEHAGKVRGIDGDFSLNQMIEKLEDSKLIVNFGGSFVSKFEKKVKQSTSLNDTLADGSNSVDIDLPENVGSMAYRMGLNYGNFSLSGEYAYKYNDPSAVNEFIYKPGEALFANASYSKKGIGILLTAKRIDNMGYRSRRTESDIQSLHINSIPDITRGHTYAMAAVYPYALQLNGESGISGEITYKLKKKSVLGGKYGTIITLNYSRLTDISRELVSGSEDTIQVLGYNSSMSNYIDELLNEDLFYQDFNIEIYKKLNKKLKGTISYVNLTHNNDALKNGGEWHSNTEHDGLIKAHVGIADISYKLKNKKSIRVEAQGMFSEQAQGDWAMGLIEFSIPHFMFTVYNQYNYSNYITNEEAHYPRASVTYVKGATRIELGYGKQREGVICTGGVCRAVPAAKGLSISIASSF